MEIEVGDWIRSKDGYIGKVKKITYEKMEEWNYYSCEKDNIMASNYLENISKYSKSIIELIEVGDYVNKHKVIEVDDFKDWIDIGEEVLREEDIKSIVTHEQFESIEYKVEEDK